MKEGDNIDKHCEATNTASRPTIYDDSGDVAPSPINVNEAGPRQTHGDDGPTVWDLIAEISNEVMDRRRAAHIDARPSKTPSRRRGIRR